MSNAPCRPAPPVDNPSSRLAALRREAAHDLAQLSPEERSANLRRAASAVLEKRMGHTRAQRRLEAIANPVAARERMLAGRRRQTLRNRDPEMLASMAEHDRELRAHRAGDQDRQNCQGRTRAAAPAPSRPPGSRRGRTTRSPSRGDPDPGEIPPSSCRRRGHKFIFPGGAP